MLLADNFNDGNFIGWSVVDEGTLYGPSAWSATTGRFVQSSNISSDDGGVGLAKPGTFALYTVGGE